MTEISAGCAAIRRSSWSTGSTRSSRLIVGILKTLGLRGALLEVSGEFGKVVSDELSRDFAAVADGDFAYAFE